MSEYYVRRRANQTGARYPPKSLVAVSPLFFDVT
jgi:hypothetical protein